jgi:Asp-tRNA(Asn)/Glu-tRNA(Gln) amidotransferase A subunit family amidase
MEQLLALDATAQLAALSAGRVSAADLLEATLRRHREINGP